MADGLNRVTLIGNLGADPELRVLNDGKSVLRLRLATSSSWLDDNRVRQERTEWHSCTVWGKRAEGLAKILSKGDRLAVEGEIRYSQYDDKDGIKRYRAEISVRNVVLCGSSRSSSSGGAGGGSREEYQAPPEPEGYGAGDDDIPF